MADLIVRGTWWWHSCQACFSWGLSSKGIWAAIGITVSWTFGKWVTCRSFCGRGHLSALLSLPSKPLLWLRLCEGQGLPSLLSVPSLWKAHCPFLNSPSSLFPCCFLYFFCIFFCHFLLDVATSFSKLICGTAGRKQTGKSQTTRTLGRISWGEHSPYHFTKDVIHLVPSLTTVLFGVFSFLVFHAASVLSFTSFHSLSSGPHFDPSLLFVLF